MTRDRSRLTRRALLGGIGASPIAGRALGGAAPSRAGRPSTAERAEPPLAASWRRSYGGGADDEFRTVEATSDGGALLGGTTASMGEGESDAWLLKVDADGNEQWSRTFGVEGADFGTAIEVSTGGYLVGGQTDSFGHGSLDIWLERLEEDGSTRWRQAYGGAENEFFSDVVETGNGQFLAVGETISHGYVDQEGRTRTGWALRINDDGSTQWTRRYGASGEDALERIVPTSDGYLLLGRTKSYASGIVTWDAWAIQLDSAFSKPWEETYGDSDGYDAFHGAVEAADGGYLLLGSRGDRGSMVVRVDGGGNQRWKRDYGGSSTHRVADAVEMPDGGFLLAGRTPSGGATNGWIARAHADEIQQWQQEFGGGGDYAFQRVFRPERGGFLLVGEAGGNGGDAWALKLDDAATEVWRSTYGGAGGEVVSAVDVTGPNRLLVAGRTTTATSGGWDGWAMRLAPRNQPPSARFSVSPADPRPGQRVRFDASASADTDGSIVQYAWDFDGDGQVDATGRQVARSFEEPGTYRVTLTVRDDRGDTVTTRKLIEVEPPNRKPRPAFSVVTDNAVVGREVTFDASGSADPDGSIEQYAWDFDRDGQVDATGQRVTHTFEEAGTYRVRLIVRDDGGKTATLGKVVRVTPPNEPPSASFSVSPKRPTTGESVRFVADATDPDGRITAFRWDFDGDGQPEAEGPRVTHVFRNPGEKTVALTVVDDDGGEKTVRKRIRVTVPSTPTETSLLEGLPVTAIGGGLGGALLLAVAAVAWRRRSGRSGVRSVPSTPPTADEDADQEVDRQVIREWLDEADQMMDDERYREAADVYEDTLVAIDAGSNVTESQEERAQRGYVEAYLEPLRERFEAAESRFHQDEYDSAAGEFGDLVSELTRLGSLAEAYGLDSERDRIEEMKGECERYRDISGQLGG